MNRIDTVKNALEYIEKYLLEVEDASQIAKKLHLPVSDLQTSFVVIVGYSVSEYIRYRRLYEAAKELMSSDVRIIDVSLKYGYESPDSFTKAFYRFHGVLPSKIGRANNRGRVFRPIFVDISVKGGADRRYQITSRYGFKLIGITESSKGRSIEEIRECFYRKYGNMIDHIKPPCDETERAIVDNSVGEYGFYDHHNETYMIAGRYVGGSVPENMDLLKFDDSLWAVSDYHGAVSRGLFDQIENMMIEDITDINEYCLKQPVRLECYGAMNWNQFDDCDQFKMLIPVERVSAGKIDVPIKIVNLLSIILIIVALAIGAIKYQKDTEKEIDTDVLYSLAQYSLVYDRVEE